MKRVGAILLIGLVIFYGCKKAEEKAATMGFKTRPELKVVSLPMKGPYQEAGTAFKTLFTFLGQEGIETSGPPMGIYLSDPAKVAPEELKYEVMAPVAKEVEVDSPYIFKTLPTQEVAYTIHKGSYETLMNTYNSLKSFISEKGYEITGPPLEIYLTRMGATTGEEPLTEIQFPVEKK